MRQQGASARQRRGTWRRTTGIVLAVLALFVPAMLHAHGGGAAGFSGERRDTGYGGPACGGSLEEAPRFRAAVESIVRSCHADAYFRARGLDSAMVDLEVRVRGTALQITTFTGSPSADVDRCVRSEIRRVPARTEGGCVDQYFRIPLVAPRLPPPTTPVTLDEAAFALLAAVDTSGAPLEELLDRSWAYVVPPSRAQRPSPVDLVNLWLVERPGTSFDLASPDLPAARRGDVARVWLYVLHAYGLSLSRDELDVILRADREDPVDVAERERDRRIHRLQGTSNPFVGALP